MKKLYIYAIGGTGSRVLKSMLMLLASGVEMNDYEVVPIIIDPDISSGDVSNTINLLRNYKMIHDSLEYPSKIENSCFKTRIHESIPGYRMSIKETQDKRFSDFIHYNSMGNENQALTSMLFSEANLNSDMKVGFKGNPNIGSVVLNQFNTSDEYKDFVNSFNQDDKIFIISSIFGGTGASGFPLLLKTLREQSGIIGNSSIGAITVLPYFKVKESEESSIDSNTFISKTKAALEYYRKNLNGLDNLYYIGDNPSATYDNIEGGVNQKNNANFIELLSALSIVDFIYNNEGRNVVTQYKEFGLKNESNSYNFTDLYDKTNEMIKQKLIKMHFIKIYWNEIINNKKTVKNQPWYKEHVGSEQDIDTTTFGKYFTDFLNFNDIWFKELRNNSPEFAPFTIDYGKKIFSSIASIQANNVGTLFHKEMSYFHNILNKLHVSSTLNVSTKFFEIMNGAIDEMISKCYKS